MDARPQSAQLIGYAQQNADASPALRLGGRNRNARDKR